MDGCDSIRWWAKKRAWESVVGYGFERLN